jgi:hypothetical protein
MRTATVDQRAAVVRALMVKYQVNPDILGKASDTTDEAFSKAWGFGQFAVHMHNPQFLWGMFAVTDDPNGYGSKFWAEQKAGSDGSAGLFKGYQADGSAGNPGDNVRIFQVTLTDQQGQPHHANFALALQNNLWLITQNSGALDY